MEELSETCRVLFQNKFEKLVHLVGFIIRTTDIGTFLFEKQSRSWAGSCCVHSVYTHGHPRQGSRSISDGSRWKRIHRPGDLDWRSAKVTHCSD